MPRGPYAQIWNLMRPKHPPSKTRRPAGSLTNLRCQKIPRCLHRFNGLCFDREGWNTILRPWAWTMICLSHPEAVKQEACPSPPPSLCMDHPGWLRGSLIGCKLDTNTAIYIQTVKVNIPLMYWGPTEAWKFNILVKACDETHGPWQGWNHLRKKRSSV